MFNVDDKLDRMRSAVSRLVEKANDDGIITQEEASILSKAEAALKTYEETVETALEDGIIDQNEKNTLIDLEERLLSDTYYTAVEDDVINEDELLLLKTLTLTIDPKASVSWLDQDTSEDT